MDKNENLEKLEEKLHQAELERDAWKGKSKHHYEMASILVESIKKELEKEKIK